MTILENVSLPLAYRGKTVARRQKIAREMLERVGLADRAYFYPGQLSGGQIQRATIARALINDPKLIIADEPTGNLDSLSTRLVMELLSEIHKTGNTVLLVTHNHELTRYASRILYMYDGMIVKDEKTKIGEISKKAQEQSVVFVPKATEEEDLLSVSAIMSEIPTADDGDTKTKKTKKKRKRKTKKKITAKRKKRRAPRK